MGPPFQLPRREPLARQRGETFVSLVELMRRLLGVDGCPWDREQDYKSLRRYVLEEACEVIDAIDAADRKQLQEELGDLVLQVVFLSELARSDGWFGPDDVVLGICAKLVRRHPHVFGEVEVRSADEVVQNWQAIKRGEKQERGVLDGLPRSSPALHRAQRMGERVARVGFDWPEPRGVRAKVGEELRELDQALASGDTERLEHELGDVLFALANLARHQGIDAEFALRRATDRFAARFAHVEKRVKERHGGWPQRQLHEPGAALSLEELDAYWEEAKHGET
jgi:MazG family protein